ncbi:hypothetical protein N180_05020 [Pedobacter antarcticus 4BY]|uniref:TonB-dependent receptor plug domain-containing protein n=1 Tax=Pedobacter antarcticus 4BY TaxID=1358423 RepID=A0A081PIR4_9SPHI|nr:TonB-dependent receptor plug domain-containing protein [Pedobacter antarcticus]KEQ30587.1 hypothetical protein N180_05020 [Pedobacter antarcticus 4BY]
MKRVLLVFMVLFTCYSVADAQTKKITGTVIGQDDNQPIPGASIKVEGSTAGTVTDGKGNFSLQVPQNSTLVISFIGYSNKTIKVTGDSNYKILLGEDSKKLEEVVVTSFGIARDKKTLGYGVSKVSGESLTKSPTPDITNALAGKVAGVQISGSGGGFTSSNVTIRGFSSIARSNQPLYVIDGVPIDNGGGSNTVNAGVASSSRASDVNPEDIESINVLKGAAATVLYGSRAASGVILITTKKGKKVDVARCPLLLIQQSG